MYRIGVRYPMYVSVSHDIEIGWGIVQMNAIVSYSRDGTRRVLNVVHHAPSSRKRAGAEAVGAYYIRWFVETHLRFWPRSLLEESGALEVLNN